MYYDWTQPSLLFSYSCEVKNGVAGFCSYFILESYFFYGIYTIWKSMLVPFEKENAFHRLWQILGTCLGKLTSGQCHLALVWEKCMGDNVLSSFYGHLLKQWRKGGKGRVGEWVDSLLARLMVDCVDCYRSEIANGFVGKLTYFRFFWKDKNQKVMLFFCRTVDPIGLFFTKSFSGNNSVEKRRKENGGCISFIFPFFFLHLHFIYYF